ncbi:hypothetical protein GIB67_011870 [Kingdonia uniflora]|uniref:Uncharacterized protein n=1 Tax=Kingdonia uniflora TaxID=39325 RepID=A0A7J7KVY6_9MAGN|nr:hypothetical protein GIB67_011870 [Kingdonia uniflora]
MPSKGMGNICFTSNKSACPSSPSFSLNSQQQKRITTSPVYSYSQSMTNETIVTSAEIINKWNPDTSTYAKITSLFYENREEAKDFLKFVKDLQKAMKYLVAKNPNSEKLVEAHNLMEIAMKRLEKEFYMNLSMNHDHLDPKSISSRSSVSHASNASDGSKLRSSLSRPNPGLPLQCPEHSGIRDRTAYTHVPSSCTSHLHGRGALVAYNPRMLEQHPDNPEYL